MVVPTSKFPPKACKAKYPQAWLPSFWVLIWPPLLLSENINTLPPVVVPLKFELAKIACPPCIWNFWIGLVVPIPNWPLASKVIACVKLIALPAVPLGALNQICCPLVCWYKVEYPFTIYLLAPSKSQFDEKLDCSTSVLPLNALPFVPICNPIKGLAQAFGVTPNPKLPLASLIKLESPKALAPVNFGK